MAERNSEIISAMIAEISSIFGRELGRGELGYCVMVKKAQGMPSPISSLRIETISVSCGLG